LSYKGTSALLNIELMKSHKASTTSFLPSPKFFFLEQCRKAACHFIYKKKNSARRYQEASPRPNPLHYFSTYYNTETKYNLAYKNISSGQKAWGLGRTT
jgi:hypothetical protein